jgi:hypothetical protein
MHPDIAALPGQLTYGFLACAESTKVVSEQYKFLQDWWQSDDAKYWKDNVRKPEFGGKADEEIRVRWINTKGSISSAKPGSTSLRNFGNVNAIVDLVTSWMSHVPSEGIEDLKGSDISILTGYKEELIELKKLLPPTLRDAVEGFQNMPTMETFDKSQGSQKKIIVMSFTPTHANLLGFCKEWNRINMTITRAEDALWIVGNLDALREQLIILSKSFKCKKLALMMLDYLERGRVIDTWACNSLPASEEERQMPKNHWSIAINQPKAAAIKWDKEQQKLIDGYDAKARRANEETLIAELREIRKKAAGYEAQFNAGEDYETPLHAGVRDDGLQLDGEAEKEEELADTNEEPIDPAVAKTISQKEVNDRQELDDLEFAKNLSLEDRANDEDFERARLASLEDQRQRAQVGESSRSGPLTQKPKPKAGPSNDEQMAGSEITEEPIPPVDGGLQDDTPMNGNEDPAPLQPGSADAEVDMNDAPPVINLPTLRDYLNNLRRDDDASSLAETAGGEEDLVGDDGERLVVLPGDEDYIDWTQD